MTNNYARLCASYVAASALLKGGVGLEDFGPEAYRHLETQSLARRITVVAHDVGNPNALTPLEVELVLADGSRHATRLDVVYGNPAKPLSRADHLAKFRHNCEAAARPLARERVEGLIVRIDRLEDIADVTELVDLVVA